MKYGPKWPKYGLYQAQLALSLAQLDSTAFARGTTATLHSTTRHRSRSPLSRIHRVAFAPSPLLLHLPVSHLRVRVRVSSSS